MSLELFQRAIGTRFLCAFCGLLLACSQAKDESKVAKAIASSPTQQEFQHTFECPPPVQLKGLVDKVHFEGAVASEITTPYVGAFSASDIVFDMGGGESKSVRLEEPLGFHSEKRGTHDACGQLAFHKVGPFVFFEHLGVGGNPYPPQQLMFMKMDGGSFRPVNKLHSLIGEEFTEFEEDECLAGRRHGDGLVNKICYVDSKFALRNVLLQEQYQNDSWHTFLCEFSDDGIKIAEYQVKHTAPDETTDQDPSANMQKMLKACSLFLKRFNAQLIP